MWGAGMVADCGKPDWVAMRYQIVDIENKRPEKPNRYHKRITGKRCGIECLERGAKCWLWIEGYLDYESYTRFHTSTVMDTGGDPGTLVIETEHSVYTLVMIDCEEDSE